ncbi:MAG: flagellar hook-basal body protein FliE [Candidatus Liberibacter ctenarytainae]|uniref:Flagellar hook-basal body complex protein FliE n=1 Tax=Candidatus Liberibacter ctenarytainae TaxID=2020335 RepID=A0A937AEI0_9HYPH|nr:flagellar hook-basal body protein FliE [Candidatus Liberibacter ctenarytainae]
MIENIQRENIQIYQNSTMGVQDNFIQTEQLLNNSPSIEFSSLLQDMAKEAVSNIQKAENVSLDVLQGKASIREAVDSILQAERTLQTSVVVRDKIISAYLEISKMQI